MHTTVFITFLGLLSDKSAKLPQVIAVDDKELQVVVLVPHFLFKSIALILAFL